jgi:hypothetical protein
MKYFISHLSLFRYGMKVQDGNTYPTTAILGLDKYFYIYLISFPLMNV